MISSNRRLLAFGLVTLLSPLALAQPADDPGLDEPKPATPTPAPATTKSTTTTKSNGKSTTSTTNVSSSMVTTLTPAQGATPAPDVNEKVDTKERWIDGSDPKAVNGSATVDPGVEFYDSRSAPSLTGQVGLFKTLTGDSGKAHHFRVGLHIGGFRANSFLIAGNSQVAGDKNGRFTGDLTIGYTPWKYIELYLAIFNASNQNQRTDAGRTDPEVILSLGDIQFGLKGRYGVTKFLDLALHVGVKFLNSVSGISFSGESTNFVVDAIASFDFRKISKAPLRLHLNVGFLLDNSINLLPDGQCGLSTGNDACIRSRVVQTFAYGIGTSRMRISLALDAPVLVKTVGLQPMVEYHLQAAVGGGDTVVYEALRNDPNVTSGRLSNRLAQDILIGFRLRPVAGLIIDAAVDIGLQSAGFRYGPPTPPWNVILGLAYAYDAKSGRARTKLIEKTITREISRGPIEGKVRGFVKDATTKKALSGAVIRYVDRRENSQATGDDGSFVSYGFAPGMVTLEVTRDDYATAKVDAQIVANADTPVEILLTPKPSTGVVRGRASDASGGAVRGLTARLTNVATGAVVDAESEATGGFTVKLPAGDYTLEATADGYLAKQAQVLVIANQVQSLDLAMTKRPTLSRVKLTKNEITINGTIHFGTNNAVIAPDGQQLLDEVADVLIKSPQVKRIRVEGHTDNRGVAAKNLELSKARAASVVAYLVKSGIDGKRLESEGYGASQPLVPNITPANRAKNRRVAFKILE